MHQLSAVSPGSLGGRRSLGGAPSVVAGAPRWAHVLARSSSSGAQAAATTATATTAPAPAPAPSFEGPDPATAAAAPLAPPPAPLPPPPLPRPAGMRLRTGACCLPHPDKHHYGGEDAFFVSPAGGGALGVADGVGGWAESGINPALYSRTLMRVACAYIEGAEGDSLARAAAEAASMASADSSILGSVDLSSSGSFDSVDGGDGAAYAYGFGAAGVVAAAALAGRAHADPRAALDAAHRRTRCPGSATAVVLQLDGSRRRLVAANLGDSGFMVVRGGKVVARSRPLQHFFDCPLQLGAYPDFVDATDTAAQAEVYEIELQAGDVVVAGSDGLWDNTYETEIVDHLPSCADEAQLSAECIAALAREHASDPAFASPYTREALQQGYDLSWFDKLRGATFRDGKLQLAELTGGKQDDITVIVAYVEDDAGDASDGAGDVMGAQ